MTKTFHKLLGTKKSGGRQFQTLVGSLREAPRFSPPFCFVTVGVSATSLTMAKLRPVSPDRVTGREEGDGATTGLLLYPEENLSQKSLSLRSQDRSHVHLLTNQREISTIF